MSKLLWFDARNIDPNDNTILSLVYNSNIDYLVVQSKNRAKYKAPSKTVFVLEVKSAEELKELSTSDIIMSKSEELLTEAKALGFKTCIFLNVDDRNSLEQSWKTGMNYNFVVIEFQSVTNIPLELVIARLQGTQTSLLKLVRNTQDAEVALGVMEHGSDGVLLSTKDVKEIVRMKTYSEKLSVRKISIVPGTVKEIEHLGLGSRACVDTTAMLSQSEGMIIGSTSQGGILVSSETHFLPYMNLRPFRVNAGAVHSYIWCPDNNTEYLTDLKSGSKVMVYDFNGNGREVSVGRIKIEVRPLLKIVVEANGVELNTIVQDDWHIRILGVNGEVYNASTLSVGTELATYVCEPGRHVGLKIEETVLEK